MTSVTHQLAMKKMEPNDVLRDALINRDTQDYLWEIFTNSDECYELFISLIANGEFLPQNINSATLEKVIVNAKLTDSVLREVRTLLVSALDEL